MKAWVLNGIGDISLRETEKPVPKANEVLVRVLAAGICGSDIPRIYTTGAHRMPLIPGHEFSGSVEETGSFVSGEWLGKRVGVFPLIPCGKCGPCRNGHPEMCRDYDYIGSRRDGAFAEYVAVPADQLMEIPETVGFEEAAMLEPMAVSVHAMRQAFNEDAAPFGRDPKIAICGLGTIGLLLTMFLKDRGLDNVYVIGNKPGQKIRAVSLGVREDRFCDSSVTDPLEWITDNAGYADVFFECVGRNECVSLGVDSAAPGGRVILVGNPHSDMTLSRDTYWKILRNQLTVRGTWNSTFLGAGPSEDARDDWRYVTERLSAGTVHPENLITHRYSLEELDKGFSVMKEKSEDYCKVMMAR